MARQKIEDIVTEMVSPITEKNNFELVDVEFLKEGANWYLRVYIDKEGGISIDDCQLVSEALGQELDKVDPIPQHYFLEVSSPGIERPLKRDKDFIKYKGEQVEVKLYQPIDGKKIFEGKLNGLIDGKISIIESNNDILEFDRDKVAIVKRTIKF
ncbi:MAG TPA: ribosome maturation factor RimP [Pseudobacteroides sp.]|nr:ribosome maturation factor RimP [Pseudobacteroides sp.]